jgi:hypothetical protein
MLPEKPLSASDRLRSLLVEAGGLPEGALAPLAVRQTLSWPLYGPGLALGILTQVVAPSGGGKTEAVLDLLAAHPGMRAAWVEKRMTAYPPGLVERGVRLDFLLFVEAGEHFIWALTELVRSQVFKVLVVGSPVTEEIDLRRLQLAAEQAQAAILLLSPEPLWAWPIRTHLNVIRDPQGGLQVQALHAAKQASGLAAEA